MNEIALKYGCNPNQTPARVFAEGGLPFTVLNGRPGYINLLDALNSWQLVRELRAMSGLPAAASFKHVSPAGAALGLPLTETLARACGADGRDLSPVACAYVRARGADRMSSYGDFAAVSDVCDESLAEFLRGEVSDGIIAPGYTEGALEILKSKRKGSYLVLQMDENYVPPALERKDVYGVTFEQQRNEVAITEECLSDRPTANKDIP
ncbi:MAG: phosphoribosylaminoimidazolecarboxamide formyltransferase, partial [Selenomonas massiliensis]